MTEPTPSSTAPPRLTVEFAGEIHEVNPAEVFTIGRGGALEVDDNPFLHRDFLHITRSESLWWLSNVGSRLSATVTDSSGRVQSWLAPGARLPLVFRATTVIFTAGPTTYDLVIYCDAPSFEETRGGLVDAGLTTIGGVALTPSQHLLIVALAEPMLRREGVGMSDIPTSAAAAKRLGWALTRFNRKLDNVCDKLDRSGVPGLRGGVTKYATNRRTRLVEHAIAARLVTAADLPLLDHPQEDQDAD